MSEAVIEVRNLAKRFGSLEAITDVSFTVNRGDVFGFLGPNGAGKSTSIRCMLSLIRPDKGSILIFGKSLSVYRNLILSNTGSIIEKPDFYNYLTALKNLEIFSRISGTSSSRNEIFAMLEFVGLKGREYDRVKGYSHGMKQRLGIAQALLHNPDLIILDEPTTGLDPQGIIDIRNLILQLKREKQKTVLLSSHQLSEIELIANRMVIINRGKTVIEGEVSQLLNVEELVVNIELDNPAAAIRIINENFKTVQLLKADDNHIRISIAKTIVPSLNRKLTERGLNVFAIESKRKLEDYFIKIVSN